MKSLTDSEGNPLYNEVIVGAVIDWDRSDEDNAYRTINEIDVLAMKGAIPIFISCKNGNFDENELYKLTTVADHFGEKYAKKVLVATSISDFGEQGMYLRQRAKDMNIKLIEGVQDIDDVELEKKLRNIWNN